MNKVVSNNLRVSTNAIGRCVAVFLANGNVTCIDFCQITRCKGTAIQTIKPQEWGSEQPAIVGNIENFNALFTKVCFFVGGALFEKVLCDGVCSLDELQETLQDRLLCPSLDQSKQEEFEALQGLFVGAGIDTATQFALVFTAISFIFYNYRKFKGCTYRVAKKMSLEVHKAKKSIVFGSDLQETFEKAGRKTTK